MFFGVPRIVLKSAPGGTIWTISGERLENARFQPQIPFLSGVPRIVLKCAPGGTIWTILGQHLENRVFKPKNSILFGVPRIIMKSAPGGTVWTISGERLENALSKGPLWPAVFMVFQNGVRSKLQFHFKRRSLKACKRFAGALGCFLQVLKGLLDHFWGTSGKSCF